MGSELRSVGGKGILSRISDSINAEVHGVRVSRVKRAFARCLGTASLEIDAMAFVALFLVPPSPCRTVLHV